MNGAGDRVDLETILTWWPVLGSVILTATGYGVMKAKVDRLEKAIIDVENRWERTRQEDQARQIRLEDKIDRLIELSTK